MSIMQRRQHEGSPVGGRFATTAKPEPAVQLSAGTGELLEPMGTAKASDRETTTKCDWCDRPGSPYKYRGQWFGGLFPNRGETLCARCLNRACDEEINAPVGPMGVPAHEYITPLCPSRF